MTVRAVLSFAGRIAFLALPAVFTALPAMLGAQTMLETPASQVDTKSGVTCAVVSGGVRCWGDNFYGQLGDGSTTNSPIPVQTIPAGSGATSVAVGFIHTCAVVAGGVRCWGTNNKGQLGNGNTTNSLVPVQAIPAGSQVTGVAAGENFTCVVQQGGVRCWGNNFYGTLGNGSNTDSLSPVQAIASGSGVSQVSAHGLHVCAVVGGGVRCWGNNFSGKLGDGSSTHSNVPVQAIAPYSGAVSVGAGNAHTCAVVSGGVQCWGAGSFGQLGTGNFSSSLIPVPVIASGATQVSAGFDYSCAVVSGGLQCWGRNLGGVLGNNSLTNSNLPVQTIAVSSSVSQVSAGSGSTCAVRAGGLLCWGSDGSGELGNDSALNDSIVPVPVLGHAAGLLAISAGDANTCALSASGRAYCWGLNANGQLGDGTTTNRLSPVPVLGGATGVKAINSSMGGQHACQVLASGQAQCWGSNFGGQLGDGTTTDRLAPTSVSTLSNAVDIKAGFYDSCALTTVGGVKCWGLNSSGEVGDGTTTQRNTPVDVSGLTSGVASIAMGGLHACAVTTTGGLRCWGDNSNGQLGDGTITARSTPITPAGFSSGVAAVTAGYYHTCVLTTAGAVQCWGNNTAGQLGDGSTTQRTTAVQVSTLTSGVTNVSAGAFHTCAVTSSGAARCWGQNSNFQLGDGSPTQRLTPNPVGGLSTGVARIEAGGNYTCVIMASASLRCWGASASGQLGTGGTLTYGNAVEIRPSNHISFAAPERINLGQTGSITVSASTGLAVSVTSLTSATCTLSGSTVTPLVAGTCLLAANQPGNGATPPAPEVVRAIAVTQARTLTVSKSGTAASISSVDSTPAGIACGSTCSADYIQDETVILQANPGPGSQFTGWAGACTGTASCTVAMSQARSVTAFFVLTNFVLTTNRSGTGTGVISSVPAGINCGADCSETLATGTAVTLSATPGQGSAFTSWSGVTCTGGNVSATCSFALTANTTVTATFDSSLVVPNDFNDDARSDLLWRNGGDGSVQGWLMNGLAATQVAGLLPAGGYTVTHVADLDGNGKADTLIRHTDGTTIGWLHDGLNVVGQATFFAPGSGWSIKHTADLNGDGKADLIVENTDGTVIGWLMNGLTVTGTATFVPAGTGWSVSRVGDLNGDGKADLIWQNSNGTVQAWLMDGLSATQTATFVGAGTGWSVKLIADFNGDNKADLVWQNTDGTVQAWLMDGTAITQIASFVPAGTGWSPVLAGDIDGDGKADLFWEHTDGRSQTWLMNGLSVTALAGFVGAGGWKATHLLDLNGDGKKDVLWKHTDGTVQAWLMNGLTISQIASLAGAGSYEVIPAR